ncbi:MAG: Crp/Fnr family transcriptional regulator [Spirochaetes bacterium]|nr:Crp/Fnr family transcriptional regulator [Spirochaetota bacterium]
MPKPLKYNLGSLIFCQGDVADKVFILQSGKVNLVSQDIETNADIHDLVQVGEFFGAKSALGRYVREENAVVITDQVSVMAFSISEFEAFLMSNPGVVMKILKVFSKQMRRIHKHEENLVTKKELDSAEGLFSIGEYYLKNKRYSYAKYIFTRYLEYYKDRETADSAREKLEIIEKILRGEKEEVQEGTGETGDTEDTPGQSLDAKASAKEQG